MEEPGNRLFMKFIEILGSPLGQTRMGRINGGHNYFPRTLMRHGTWNGFIMHTQEATVASVW